MADRNAHVHPNFRTLLNIISEPPRRALMADQHIEQKAEILRSTFTRALMAIGLRQVEVPERTDDEENVITLHYANLGVTFDVGTLVSMPTIGATIQAPGYRAYYWKSSPGNRHTPPDEWDVTIYEGPSLPAALQATCEFLAKELIAGCIDAALAESDAWKWQPYHVTDERDAWPTAADERP